MTGPVGRPALPSPLAVILHETAVELGEDGPPQILAGGEEAGTHIARFGDHVVKIHSRDVRSGELHWRLRTAAALADVFLSPTTPAPRMRDGRLVTVWPWGRPVDPQAPDEVPWAAAGELLARLHCASVETGEWRDDLTSLPLQGFPASVRDSLSRLTKTCDAALLDVGARNGAREAVMAAARGLPTWALSTGGAIPGRPRRLVHGDFHLGQLVCRQSQEQIWLLIDIDSLGLGDPAWDLARPAMWMLAGVIAPQDWGELIDSYARAGGRAVDSDDPWPVLEPIARAAAVQAGASALARAGRTGTPLDDLGEAFVAACERIAER